jgi:hypothetical protein
VNVYRAITAAAVAIAVAAVAIAMAAVAIAGCGGTATTPSKVQQAQSTHEYPAAKARPQTVIPGAISQVDAIRHFAQTYINWTPETVAGQMRELAAQSIGQARSAMELAASQTSHDYELQQGGISNSGTVEAVAPLPNGRNRYVVVTRERTSATNTTAYEGLRPAWHVALATVSRQPDGRWVVSGWQPEN